jgi:hypothetical protein
MWDLIPVSPYDLFVFADGKSSAFHPGHCEPMVRAQISERQWVVKSSIRNVAVALQNPVALQNSRVVRLRNRIYLEVESNVFLFLIDEMYASASRSASADVWTE